MAGELSGTISMSSSLAGVLRGAGGVTGAISTSTSTAAVLGGAGALVGAVGYETNLLTNGTFEAKTDYSELLTDTGLETWDTPSELLTDGGMEAWDDANTLTNWSKVETGASVLVRSEDENSGTYAAMLDIDSGDYVIIYQDLSVTAGKAYEFTFYHKESGSDGVQYRFRDTVPAPDESLQSDGTWGTTDHWFQETASAGYTQASFKFVAQSTGTMRVYFLGDNANDHYYIDDVSLKALPVLANWTFAPLRFTMTEKETVDVHGGSAAVRIDVDAGANVGLIWQTLGTLTSGVAYELHVWGKADSGADPLVRISNGSNDELNADGTWSDSGYDFSWADTDWTEKVIKFVPDETSAHRVILWGNVASKSFYYDDITCKRMSTFDGWTHRPNKFSVIEVEDSDIQGGSYAARIDVDAAGTDAKLIQIFSLTSGVTYKLSVYGKADSGVDPSLYIYDETEGKFLRLDGTWGSFYQHTWTDTGYTQKSIYFTTASTGNHRIYLYSGFTASKSYYYDTLSLTVPYACGKLTGSGSLTGAVSTATTTAAVLKGAGPLTGAISTSSALTGHLGGAGKLIGAIAGETTSTALIRGTGILVGTIEGATSSTAHLDGAGKLVGSYSTSSSAEGVIFDGTYITWNLFDNGSFEQWDSSTDCQDWTETVAGSSTVTRGGTDLDVGVYACKLTIDGSDNSASTKQTVALAKNTQYAMSIEHFETATATMKYSIVNGTSGEYLQADGTFGAEYWFEETHADAYTPATKTFTADASANFTFTFKEGSNVTSQTIYLDDARLNEVIAAGFLPKPAVPRIQVAHPIRQHCVGCWSMYEGSGTQLNDISYLGNHGTLTTANGGLPEWTGSHWGHALDFDAQGYVSIPTQPEYMGGATGKPELGIVETVWLDVLPSVVGRDYIIAWKKHSGAPNYSWLLYVPAATDKITLVTVSTGSTAKTVEADAAAEIDKPYHVVCTVDNSHVSKMYIDAVLQADTETNDAGLYQSDGIVELSHSGTSQLDGGLIEHSLYDKALNQEEVSWLYHDPWAGLRAANVWQHQRLRLQKAGR